MYGYIYETTNLINGKKYIGKHKSDVFDVKYKGTGKIIRKAIDKYGWDNFDCKILQECDSREELNTQEKYWIEKFDATNSDDYYNIAQGGEGGSHPCSPETRALLSKLKKGKDNGHTGCVWVNNTVDNKLIKFEKLDEYLANGYVKGKIINEITREKFRQAGKLGGQKLKGKSKSLAHRKHISENHSGGPQVGHITSNATKDKMRKAHLGKSAYWNIGLIRSNDVRLKISESIKGRIWINKSGNSKMIDKNEYLEYKNIGWKLGRK